MVSTQEIYEATQVEEGLDSLVSTQEIYEATLVEEGSGSI